MRQALKLLFFTILIFSNWAYSQTVTNILGPKKYFVTNSSGSTYTENISRTSSQLTNQYKYKLIIKNADGADHPLKNCTGLGFIQKIICQAQNTVAQTYINTFRVTGATISLNNVNLTTPSTFNKNTLLTEIQLTLQQSNQLSISLQGGLASFIDVRLESTYNANADITPPTILASISTNATTNVPHFHVSITDASATTTSVYKSSTLVSTQTVKEFDVTLSEGVNNFSIVSFDANTNQSTLTLNNITLDSTPALVTTTLQSQYIYSSYPQNFTITFNSNEDLTALYVNNTVATMLDPRTFSYTVNIASPQSLNFDLRSYDLLGNEGLQTYTANFGLDNIAPVVSANKSNNAYTNQNNLVFTITDNANTTTEVYKNNSLVQTTANKTIAVTLTEGVNNFTIRTQDEYNNQALDFNLTINYDSTAPNLISNADMVHFYVNQLPNTLDLAWAASEALQSFTADGNTLTPVDHPIYEKIYQFSKSISSVSGNTVTVVATDLAGNATTKTYNLTVDLDTQAPVLTLGSYPTLTTLGVVTIPVSISDLSDVNTNVYVNGNHVYEDVEDNNFSINVNMPTYGVYNVQFHIEDQAGNATDRTITITRKADIIPPTITSNTGNTFYVNALPANLNVQINSNETLKTLTIDGQAQTVGAGILSWNFNKSITSTNGNQVTVVAVDLWDNVRSVTLPLTVVLDNTSPVITLGSTPAVTDQNSILLSVNVNESNTVQTDIRVNNSLLATVTEKSFSYLISLPTDGIYTIALKSTDVAGNFSTQSVSIEKEGGVLALTVTSPVEAQIYDSQLVQVSFSSNKIIYKAYVNNIEVTPELDHKNVSYSLAVPSEGNFTTEIKIEDRMGHIETKNITAQVYLGSNLIWTYKECPATGE